MTVIALQSNPPYWVGNLPNLIVVDPTGDSPDSHLTLGSALSTASSGDVIMIAGNTVETDNIIVDSVSGLTIDIWSGCSINLSGFDLISSVAEITFMGFGTLTTGGGTFGVTSTASPSLLNLSCIKIDGGISVVSSGNTSTVSASTVTVSNGSGAALSSAGSTGSFIVELYYSNFTGSTYGFNITSQANVPLLDTMNSTIVHSRFNGGLVGVNSDDAISDAPFFHCIFENGVTNITADAGSGNGTNTVP